MTYLLFTVALALSAVAAWYAIAGLVAIFAAATVPIMIMGGLLEVSKLVVASWLYRSWKEIPLLLKSYFSVALVVLMFLTSMGIFGFLSKAHLDQAVPTSDVAAQVALLDEKINTQKQNIESARAQISQMDAISNQSLSRTDDTKGVERANQIRRQQRAERQTLLAEIGAAQQEITKLNEEKAPLAKDLRKIEAEVGPIKYIAALIYGDSVDQDLLEKAVRIVTLLIVAVFDPLAVLMLVAANWSLKNKENSNEFWRLPKLPTKATEKPEPESKTKEKTVIDETVIKDELKIDSESELPEITIDHPKTDWNPSNEKPKKLLGRYLQEIGAKPPKTESFLSKVQSVFNPVGIKTIEKEVDDLQSND